MRGKEACKGLVTCNYKVRICPSWWVRPLSRYLPSLSPRRAVQRPNGNTRDVPCPSPRVALSPRLPGGNRRRSDLSSLFPCTFTERMGCVHATSTCPNDDDRRSSIGLCMIRDNHSIGIRNIGVSRLPLHPTRGPATRMLSHNNQPGVRSFSLGSTSNFADLADQIGTVY